MLSAHAALKARPISSLTVISRTSGLSFPSAASAVQSLVSLGIFRELTGKRRNRVFGYTAMLEKLSADEGMG